MIADEVDGFASGMEPDLPRYFSWMLGMSAEIDAVLRGLPVPQARKYASRYGSFGHKSKVIADGDLRCSDVHVNFRENGTTLHGHNEDGDPLVPHFGYFVNATYTDGPQASFVAFHYPDQLAGNAFGWSSTGTSFSTNALFPKQFSLKAVPRSVLNRAMMDAHSPMEAVEIIRRTPGGSAYGFNLNTGHSTELLDLEVAPDSTLFLMERKKLLYVVTISLWSA